MHAIDRLARKVVFAYLDGIDKGQLAVIDGTGRERCFGREHAGLQTRVEICDAKLYRQLLVRGSLGAAESYMEGRWGCSNLTALFRIFLRHGDVMAALDSGLARWTVHLGNWRRWLEGNSPRRSRRHIAHHYDLGNDFFALFLDPTMAYSCAYFEADDDTLERASLRKFDRILDKLEIRSGDHLLEIGSGWGGLALHAARRHGCRVTTTTISAEQYAHVRRLIAEQGLAGQVEVLLRDYRELTGTYDKLVSVEMVEAVGHRNLPGFFGHCGRLLKPEGRMVLQTITIQDQLHASHLHRPTSCNATYSRAAASRPSPACARLSTAGSDLRLCHLEDLTPHYVRTMQHWRRNFLGQLDAARRLGCDEPFLACGITTSVTARPASPSATWATCT